MVDFLIGWTETEALPNKACKCVVEALDAHRCDFPFVLRRIDSDNGSEFIHSRLVAWCDTPQATLICSRAYHKNDGGLCRAEN